MKRYQKLRPCLALSALLTTVFLTSTASTMLLTQPGVAQIPTPFPDFENNSGDNQTLPTVTVIKQDFANAKGWRLTWQGGVITDENWTKVQSIFSTATGAVNSVDFLNNTSSGNTNNADFMLFSGLKATSEISQLTKKTALHATTFKLTSMTVNDLQNAAENNPNLFGLIYGLAFDAPTTTKSYQAGQIYVFKTDRTPAKYGAVRIVSMNPRVIEVVVQK